jgi:hypothetical protein
MRSRGFEILRVTFLFEKKKRGTAVHGEERVATMSAFTSFKRYLANLQSSMAADQFEPDPILDEHVASAGHVVECLAKLRRGEGITSVDALRAGKGCGRCWTGTSSSRARHTSPATPLLPRDETG